ALAHGRLLARRRELGELDDPVEPVAEIEVRALRAELHDRAGDLLPGLDPLRTLALALLEELGEALLSLEDLVGHGVTSRSPQGGRRVLAFPGRRANGRPLP